MELVFQSRHFGSRLHALNQYTVLPFQLSGFSSNASSSESFLDFFPAKLLFSPLQDPLVLKCSFIAPCTHSFNIHWNIFTEYLLWSNILLCIGNIFIYNSLYNPTLEFFLSSLVPCGLPEDVNLYNSFNILHGTWHAVHSLSSVNAFCRNKLIVIKNGDDSNNNVNHSDKSGVQLPQCGPGARYIVTIEPQARRLLGRWQVPSACIPSRCCHHDYFCH